MKDFRKDQFLYNERTRFLIDIMKNLATASCTLGFLTPVIDGKIFWLPSISIGMGLALAFGYFGTRMIRDLWSPDELAQARQLD